jgi:prepilin-type N-terminal cleavage/methylation domain-containing protein/prepilin-type processing-associated H-X9-DG protein
MGGEMNHCRNAEARTGFTRWAGPVVSRKRAAFTLVELLVVIAIIGILVALLLPAIQSAREAARRTHCKNNVKNIALGCLMHVDTYKEYPSGGWGLYYPADPNRGQGPRQPGSWQYNILPFVEENALHDLGKGLASASLDFHNAIIKLHTTPVPLFSCPTRRVSRPITSSWTGILSHNYLTGTAARTGVIKSDYAANTGDALVWAGDDPPMKQPSSYTQADTTMQWTVTNSCNDRRDKDFKTCQDGIMYYRSDVKVQQITDGTAHTYLVGEKAMDPLNYEGTNNGFNYGDNQDIYSGFEWDNHRVAWQAGADYAVDYYQPAQDRMGDDNWGRFGSAHSGGLNMAFCDGSIQTVSYNIDSTMHRWLAVRFDGQVTDNP